MSWLAERTGKDYRLPTEAEWEYAARAGTTTPFSFGLTINPKQAVYNAQYTYSSSTGSQSDPKGKYPKRTAAAGSLPANSWGLHEMHGNVSEWVEDCYHDSYKGAPTDGSAWVDASCGGYLLRGVEQVLYGVIRGGIWFAPPKDLRSAARVYKPFQWGEGTGFRVARTITR